jgi:hypothetical protein
LPLTQIIGQALYVTLPLIMLLQHKSYFVEVRRIPGCRNRGYIEHQPDAAK